MQPIRKAVDFKRYYSNELNNLLNNMMSFVLNENPIGEITTDFFLMYALETQDCMLYKAVNSFLNSFIIDTIHNNLCLKVQDGLLSAIRPGRTIEYSNEFVNYLSKSNEEKDKLHCKLITSDHVLLSILNDKNNTRLNNIFKENGLTYDTLFEKTGNLHSLTDEVNKISNLDEAINTKEKVFDKKLLNDMQKVFPSLLKQLPYDKKQNKYQIPYCKNLNKLAEIGRIDSIVGRENEIFKIEKIFSRRKCNNVIIVGKSGTGKTSLIEGLAKKIVDRTAPLSMLDLKIFILDTAALVSGTNLRGMFEDRVNKMFSELKKYKNSVLFIDDAHSLINEKKNDDYGLIDIISDYVSDDSVKIILSTNEKGYKTILSSGQNIMRKCQKVLIEGTNEEETLCILKNIKKYYEKYHNVIYPNNVLEDIVKLSKRYIPEVSLPSSAIDIMDELGALKKIKLKETDEIKNKKNTLFLLKEEKDRLIKQDKIDDAKKINEEINRLNTAIVLELSELEKKFEINKTITTDDLYEALSQHTDIPISKISVSEKKIISNIDKVLKKSVIGQDEAINLITNAIKRSKVGLYPSNRPIMVGMLIGPSGTGKTLTAKMLAKEIFGDEKYLIRFDMSEYSDKTSVNKLIGSNAGYVGYENGGLLTEAIKNKKHAVLLIDEIEKANDEVYNLFLQVFDDGFLNDNQGNKVDFKNTIILLTSNVGVKRALNERSIGFNKDSNLDKKEIIKKELKSKFPPEFINRIDNIIYYNELNEENLKSIIRLEISKLIDRLTNIGYKMTYQDSVIDYIFTIIEKEKEYGARPITRAIQNEIENKITDLILDNENIDNILVDVINGNIIVS